MASDTRFELHPAAAVKLTQIGSLTPVYSEGRVYALNFGTPLCVFELPEEDKHDVNAPKYLDLCIDDILDRARYAKANEDLFWRARDFDYKKQFKDLMSEIERVNLEAALKAERQRQLAADKAQKAKLEEEITLRAAKLRSVLVPQYNDLIHSLRDERQKYQDRVSAYMQKRHNLSPKDLTIVSCLMWLKDVYLNSAENLELTQAKINREFDAFCEKHYLFMNKKGEYIFSQSADYYEDPYAPWGWNFSVPTDPPAYINVADIGRIYFNSNYTSSLLGLMAQLKAKEIMLDSSVPSPSKRYKFSMLNPKFKDFTGEQLCDLFFGFSAEEE